MTAETATDPAPAEPADAGDDLRDRDAGRLRDAGPRERRLRLLLAVLVLAATAFAAYEHLTRPRTIHAAFGRPDELLYDAAAGRLERLDVDGLHPPRWRTTSGAVYEYDDPVRGDVRAMVETQHAVRQNPGAVTYGPIRVSRVTASDPFQVAAAVGWLALVVTLVRGPRPRRATRWGWFWVVSQLPGLGAAAYLALAGSWSHAERLRPGRTRSSQRRLGGTAAFLLCVLLAVTWAVAADAYYDGRHPRPRYTETAILPDVTR